MKKQYLGKVPHHAITNVLNITKHPGNRDVEFHTFDHAIGCLPDTLI